MTIESKDHLRLKKSSANLSITSNLTLTLLKLIVGFATSALSVISEAVHSGIDLLAAIIARYAVVTGMKPPDEDHRFGHGKLENLASLVEVALIIIISAVIIYSSIKKIMLGVKIQHVGWGILVMAFSSVVNILVARRVKWVSKETDSQALEANALHIISDAYCSIGVFVGLLLIYIGGFLNINLAIIDPIIAALIALYITYIAYGLVKRAVSVLVDTRLSEQEEKRIISSIEKYYGELLNFHALRTRKAGFTKHVDVHIVVSKDKHVHEAHDLCDKLEKEIKKNLPGSDIVIHIEPCDNDCSECEYYHHQCRKD